MSFTLLAYFGFCYFFVVIVGCFALVIAAGATLTWLVTRRKNRLD